jgi:hypothetical protein
MKDYGIKMRDSAGREIWLSINADSIRELIETGLTLAEAIEAVESNTFANAIYRGEIGDDATLIESERPQFPAAPVAETNNAAKRGLRASAVVRFGPVLRFAAFAVHTRFDAVQWFIADDLVLDPLTGRPEIIGQAATFDAAIAGLTN